MIKSVVLFSGGIDSAVCVALEQEAGREVWPLFFNYGQRHAERERMAMFAQCREQGIWGRARIEVLRLGGSSLLGDGDLSGARAVVPDRNLILCGVASNYAASIGAKRVVIGCNATDYELFPDCRPDFFVLLPTSTIVVTPLIHLTKREIVAEARRLGVPLELTWSCYAGGEVPCGECGACVEREAALQ